MLSQLPYCGSPPSPGELLNRFNLDPVLMAALATLVVAHARALLATASRHTPDSHLCRRLLGYGLCGWLITAAALISPLCALSVSLFSARVAQHMILVLIGRCT
jgi:putative membrane protein